MRKTIWLMLLLPACEAQLHMTAPSIGGASPPPAETAPTLPAPPLTPTQATPSPTLPPAPPEPTPEPSKVERQNPGQEASCRETFRERLVDAKNAIAAAQRYKTEYERVMPWFEAHCRLLSQTEIVVRKLNDPAAFVCGTNKGRPKELDSKFLATHGTGPSAPAVFSNRSNDNYLCLKIDPIPLDLNDESLPNIATILCHESANPGCHNK